MAPVQVTEDYYMILEVEPTAQRQSIVASYRKLAFKLHPDRNKNHDATAAFQLLQRAYETLEDASKRRVYDLVYPSLRKQGFPPKSTPKSYPSSAPSSQSEFLSEAAQIAAYEKIKQERATRWHISKNAFDTSIFEIQRGIRKLDQEIQNLNSIVAAEAALEAQKNSWGTWLLSPFYKKIEESEDVKARKDIERQERRVEKDMKERRLQAKKADLKMQEDRRRKAKEQVDAADRDDDEKIRAILARRMGRENRERQQREREEWAKQHRERQEREANEKAERERMAELFRKRREEHEKQQREAAEAIRKRQAELRATERKRQQDERERWQRHFGFDAETRNRRNPYSSSSSAPMGTHQAGTSSCKHGGWWSKVEGRTPCPECSDVWTYLLQCPGCQTMACPKCQAAMRPRSSRNRAATNPRPRHRERSRSPTYNYDYFD